MTIVISSAWLKGEGEATWLQSPNTQQNATESYTLDLYLITALM